MFKKRSIIKNALAFYGTLACVFLFVAQRQVCMSGASRGVFLCINTVIPAVFPFTVICKLLVRTGAVEHLGVLATGMICGFPTGAHMCADLYTSGALDRCTAEKLCAVTNGMTPTFVIGFVGAYYMKSAEKGVWVYIICAFSAYFYFKVSGGVSFSQKHSGRRYPLSSAFEAVIHESIASIFSVCGVVVFFSVLCEFFTLTVPPCAFPYVCLLTEMTTGIFNSANLANVLSERVFFSLMCAFVSFSGICAHLQVISVCRKSGLGVRRFITGKLTQGVTSFFISYIIYGIIFG